jgi:hypothetical protein
MHHFNNTDNHSPPFLTRTNRNCCESRREAVVDSISGARILLRDRSCKEYLSYGRKVMHGSKNTVLYASNLAPSRDLA